MSLNGFRAFLFAAVLAAGVSGLIVGFFGSTVPQMDVFAHFRLHFLGVLLTGLTIAMLPRHGIKLMLIGGVVTLGLHPFIAWYDSPWQSSTAHAEDLSRMAPIKSGRTGSVWTESGRTKSVWTESGRTESGRIKIVSLNSWHSHRDHGQLLSFLNKQDADIVVLAEFGPNKRYLLKSLRKRYPHQADCARIWSCSMVILSKFEFSSQGTERPDWNRPSIVWGTFDFGEQKLSVVGTHIFRPIDDMQRHRREMRGLAKHVRKLPGEIVVVGDFNSTPWADSFRLFGDESGLTARGSYLPSWPAIAPQLAIDHMFRSKNIRVKSLRTAPAMGSDHLPLVAEFEIIPTGRKVVVTAQFR